MNAIKLLKAQHREVEDLFKRFENAERRSDKRLIVEALSDKLTIHAAIEEKHFYPAVKTRQTEDRLLESLEEHLAAKRLIADLLNLEPADQTFEPKVIVLKEQIEHHVGEEERELFPKVERLFSADGLEAIGREMTMTQVELERTSRPREAVRDETEAAAPLRLGRNDL